MIRTWLPVLALSLGLAATGCSSRPEPRYVHYDLGMDTPKGDSGARAVDSAYDVLHNDDRLNAAIIGYASSDGTVQSNRELSFRRARGVRDALVKRGIFPARLTIAARGSEHPVGANDTEEGRELNRRVEVFFYYPDKGDLQAQYGVRIEIQGR